MKNCPAIFSPRLSVVPNIPNYSFQVMNVLRLFADVDVSIVHSHSGNNPAVTCDFTSPTWAAEVAFILPTLPFREGQVLLAGAPRRCRGGGRRGIVPSCRRALDQWGPAAEEGSAAPGDPSASPRSRPQGPLRGASTAPAPPAHPTSPPRAGPGPSSPPKLRVNLYRDPPPPRFTPRLYLMTLNEPFSLPRTWPVGGNCRAGKDEVSPIT